MHTKDNKTTRTHKHSAVLSKVRELQAKKKDLNKINEEEAKIIDKIEDPAAEFKKCTNYVRKNISIVMKVAEKLHKVRKHQLFRLKYNRFQDYVNEEFNYTRGKPYQLTTAYELSEYINTQCDSRVLETDPQCRELLRIKEYIDEDHQKVDVEKSNLARLGGGSIF